MVLGKYDTAAFCHICHIHTIRTRHTLSTPIQHGFIPHAASSRSKYLSFECYRGTQPILWSVSWSFISVPTPPSRWSGSKPGWLRSQPGCCSYVQLRRIAHDNGISRSEGGGKLLIEFIISSQVYTKQFALSTTHLVCCLMLQNQ